MIRGSLCKYTLIAALELFVHQCGLQLIFADMCRSKTVEVIKQSDLTGSKHTDVDVPVEDGAEPAETATSTRAAQVAERAFATTTHDLKGFGLKLKSNLAFQLLD